MSSYSSKNINDIIKELPSEPGVYQFLNKNGDIIYLGKAKNLKNRVRSYFLKNQSVKTNSLVSKIDNVKFILTPNEHDALLLENNLIKNFQPPYNILLKDDKTYPWICISNEPFPRVFSTRKIVNDGSDYFGPYTSVKMLKTLLNLIKELFKLRDCNLNLSKDLIEASKYKVCLEFHIGNCKAPCVGNESENEYLVKIDQIKNILKGNLSTVHNYLTEKMQIFASSLDYENAQKIKESINLLEYYQSKSIIVSSSISNIDVFGIYEKDNRYFLNYFKVIRGSIIQSHNAEIKIRIEESIEDILIHYIISLRTKFNSKTTEILIPFDINIKISNLKICVPLKGQKKKLVELSHKNAKFYALDKLKREDSLGQPKLSVLKELQKKLHLQELPLHIECFDNSNIQGEFPVSACIVFKNAKPVKSEYRHFNIRDVKGPDDYASMQEVLIRRYSRLVKNGNQLPNLIIIDGGKGQLNASLVALNSIGLKGKIPIIGIAKRLEEIFVPNDQFPIYLDKNSPALKLIQFCRNEAHRFGINHHRLRRSKSMTDSKLINIDGIGEKTVQMLLQKYRSVKKIKEIGVNQLVKDVGRKKAEILIKYFSK